ncbi:hypothetical protein O181_038456 [Austropuccinia psidii MF-1]|uniref:Uncharacterized protein n=1 Tax=Austropuccinia psidii MF-1 TaxID=1389203 RepID=A0A9Q3DE08_9BASI|nr:hypothetical protein [Austropuccinia psidii MF-1]
MDIDQEIQVKNQKHKHVSPEERHKWRMPELPQVTRGRNRDIPLTVQELVYGGKAAGVKTSAKSLDRNNELLSSSEEIHGPRKDRRTSDGLDTHVLQGTSSTDKTLVKKPKHVVRGPEEEVGPRKGQQHIGSSPSLHKQKYASTNAKEGQANPKEQSESQAKGKGKGKIQLKELIIQVQNLENSTGHNAALFQEQLEKSDKARLELKEDIQSSINNGSLKNELPRQSTPILDRNVLNLNNDLHHTLSSNAEVETAFNFKDIQRSEEWPTFSGEGEYNNMEFMKKVDVFKVEFDIPDEYISSRLNSLFTKSEKKWYYKMRQDHVKHSSPWWKEQIISKWKNDSWRFKMENSFEEAIFNIERDRTMYWFLKQKDRLTSLHSDMSETMINKRISRECGGDLENAIRSRCIEPCSTEDYINAMEDITTRTKIGGNWYKPPMDNKNSEKPTPKPNKAHEKAPSKCHNC